MPRMVVADLGAGEGTFSQLLARRAKPGRRDRQLLPHDRIRGRRRAPKRGDEPGIPARGRDNRESRDRGRIPIDLAFFSQALHHALEPDKAVRAARRILPCPAGIVIRQPCSGTASRRPGNCIWTAGSASRRPSARAFLKSAGLSPQIEIAVVDREPESPALFRPSWRWPPKPAGRGMRFPSRSSSALRLALRTLSGAEWQTGGRESDRQEITSRSALRRSPPRLAPTERDGNEAGAHSWRCSISRSLPAEGRSISRAGPEATHGSLANAFREAGCVATGKRRDSSTRITGPWAWSSPDGKRIGTFETSKLLSGIVYCDPRGIYLERRAQFKDRPGITALVQSGPYLVEGGTMVRGLSPADPRRRTFIATDWRGHWVLGATLTSLSLADLADCLAASGKLTGWKIDRAIDLRRRIIHWLLLRSRSQETPAPRSIPGSGSAIRRNLASVTNHWSCSTGLLPLTECLISNALVLPWCSMMMSYQPK